MFDRRDGPLSSADAGRVCIVDDDPGIRDSLRFLLEDAEYDVEEVTDGGALIALLQADPRPRVVLLDRMMTRLDGIATLRLLEDAPTLRQHLTIFMTAGQELLDVDAMRLVERMTFASVNKPFDLDTLLSVVRRASQRLAERVPGNGPL
ncbi:MAG TPA: response regulator [Ktedonobacterales bacterium]|jgi:two-component system response regulator MprA|nr:response regulator [Ktedonobacterales bacterium]